MGVPPVGLSLDATVGSARDVSPLPNGGACRLNTSSPAYLPQLGKDATVGGGITPEQKDNESIPLTALEEE